MSRIQTAFAGSKRFLGYLTAGDGGFDFSLEACLALESGGVDLLEIGVPFSDPVADGPVIQRATQRALEAGTTPGDVLELGRRIRAKSEIPLLLFSYYNPVLSGGEAFLERAAGAGYDGILVVDLPPEEAGEHVSACRGLGLDTVFIASPSTLPSRFPLLEDVSSGFLYYVIRKGTTGMKEGLPEEYAPAMKALRSAIKLPVAAGFGIASRRSAAEALASADGFVVGSAFVNAVEGGADPFGLAELARTLDPREEMSKGGADAPRRVEP